MTPLPIFIGYDEREPEAFAVLSHSILRRASRPVAIVPVTRRSLARIHTRERGPLESTDFAFTRFLVPALSGYLGHAIFMDCDMLCLTDIGDVMLPVMADPGKAVYVCQHDYVPKASTKFDGHIQTKYPRKNWSSFMVFDCARCQALTPYYVETATGLELHRFQWTTDDRIGSLPLEWNWLVGEYEPNVQAKNLHFTLGGPWHGSQYACGSAADDWMLERDVMRSCSVQVAV
jgi:hypothetical protein